MTTGSARPGLVSSTPLWVIILLSVIYIVCPIDVVPDFVPVAGQLDDLLVLGATIVTAIQRMKASKGAADDSDSLSSPDQSA